MVLCEHYYHHRAGEVVKGLNLVAGACVLPHHNTFGKNWAPALSRLLPEAILVGIDEATGMLKDDPKGRWRVYGNGAVTLYGGNRTARYGPGDTFALGL
jgi:cyanophycinase